MNIYFFNTHTGEYSHTAPAKKDPRENDLRLALPAGDRGPIIYLIPKNATELPPPEQEENKARLFKNGAWMGVADFRGAHYFLPNDRKKYSIEEIGVEKPANAQDEKDSALLDEDEAMEIAAAENALYRSCLAYQVDQIDVNTESELTKAESLVEAGKATATDLPVAVAMGAFKSSLWGVPGDASDPVGTYYARKVDAVNASLGFSNMGTAPHDYAALRTERLTFLAGA